MPGASLRGIRALVTRPAAQGAALVQFIRDAGGEAIALPLIEIIPLAEKDAALNHANERLLSGLEEFDFAIFISSNAVRYALEKLDAMRLQLPPTLRCFGIGEVTAARLAGAGVAAACGVAAMNSEELLGRLEFTAPRGKRVLICKGVGGRELLVEKLRQRGATVSECALYHRAPPRITRADVDAVLRRERINVVLLSSGDALAHLLRLPGGDTAGTIAADITVVVPGARVAKLARDAGFHAVEIARNASDAEMLAALTRVLNGSATKS